MSLKDRTKRLLAHTLQDMLEDTPFERVRVTELCKRCGVTPQTFYYHFRDKYELAAWVYLYDTAETYSDTSIDLTFEGLLGNLGVYEQRRSFYQKVLKDRSQNSVDQYILAFHIRSYEDVMRHALGADDIPEQMKLDILYHAHGVWGLFRRWLSGEPMPTTPQLADAILAHMPDYLREAYASYQVSKADLLAQSSTM